jgi:hypothetical protein
MSNGAALVFFITFLLIASLFVGWLIYVKTRNKERMALIEKDKDVSDIYAKRKVNLGFPWLKIGIIATGFSIGWLVALFLSQLIPVERTAEGYYRHTIDDGPLAFGIVFLFTSVSILVAYFVDRKNNKE